MEGWDGGMVASLALCLAAARNAQCSDRDAEECRGRKGSCA
jgi:hypothetical protein